MSLYAKNSSTWQEVYELLVRNGGSWVDVEEAYVKENGVWKSFFVAGQPSLQNHTLFAINLFNASSSCGIRLLPTGELETGRNDNGTVPVWTPEFDEWVSPQIGTPGPKFEARMQLVSSAGSVIQGALGVWSQIASPLSWVLSRTISGTSAFQGTLEIRRANNPAVVASCTIELNAFVGSV